MPLAFPLAYAFSGEAVAVEDSSERAALRNEKPELGIGQLQPFWRLHDAYRNDLGAAFSSHALRVRDH
jgi:hypothetical protein